jgi:2-polyprenyl-6-methoxyphenol hydroxylase-like FAD-dependent oxidoreductase
VHHLEAPVSDLDASLAWFEAWAAHVDAVGVARSPVIDGYIGQVLALREPDGLAVRFRYSTRIPALTADALLAERMPQGGYVLTGDAAHALSPAGGQGRPSFATAFASREYAGFSQ